AGRDIKRYAQPHSDKYLILFKNGDTKEWFGDLGPDLALNKMHEKYPAILAHLMPFKERAKARYDQGQYWWELRACDYYHAFNESKIIIPAIVKSASYTVDNSGYYSNDKTSIIAT